MTVPVFLIGAGFNVDAGVEIGSAGICRYPLLSNLSSFFKGFDQKCSSIEERFAEAIQAHDRKALEALCNCLMECDNYLASQLCPGQGRSDNCYLTFLRRFPTAQFLSFNYDSLLEILLFHLNRWRPGDGYGVPVHTGTLALSDDSAELPLQSKNCVLHLHGSLCIYPQDFAMTPSGHGTLLTIRRKERSDFIFDPGEISSLFPGCEATVSGLGYRYIDERVIAPVPNKARGLTQSFIQSTYKRAREILAGVQTIVVIGYSFNPHDRASYEPLLSAGAKGICIAIVSPDAIELQARLSREYPIFQWQAVPLTFQKWARTGFHL